MRFNRKNSLYFHGGSNCALVIVCLLVWLYGDAKQSHVCNPAPIHMYIVQIDCDLILCCIEKAVQTKSVCVCYLQCATVCMYPRASKCELIGWAAAMMMMKMVMTMLIIITFNDNGDQHDKDDLHVGGNNDDDSV